MQLLALLYASQATAQWVNHVPNCSFENYISCPNATGQVTSHCQAWYAYTNGSSDYLNSCTGSPNIGVPINIFGTQAPAHGNAYAGLGVYSSNDYREYIAVPITPLQAGQSYEVSMSFSLADTFIHGANGLGVYFFKNASAFLGIMDVIPVTPQISFNNYGVITDKINWVRVRASFIADSTYDHLVIGNFSNNLNTSLTSTGTGLYTSQVYYYVDSVVVRIDRNFEINYLSDTTFCTGTTVNIPFSIYRTGYFNSSNVFTLQLSNASGSFASPLTLGTYSGANSGIIPANIPSNITLGGGYKIRIISSSPTDTSSVKNVRISQIPSVVASSNSPVCENDSINLSATSSVSGTIAYNWIGPGSFTSNNRTVTRTAATMAMAGKYAVTADLDGCKAHDTVDVTVNTTPASPVVGGKTSLCAGENLNLTAWAIPGVTYAWTGPNGYTSNQQNPIITGVKTWQAGKYTVVATLNNCPSQPADIDIKVETIPIIGAYASPSDTICHGFTTTFLAFPQNAGIIPDYQWYKNFQPIAGATGLVYSSNQLVTGDKIYCRMVAAGVCDNPVVATTDTFNMVVLPVVTVPAVTISANPGVDVRPTDQVVFTANVMHGGTTPKYQWFKNGVIQNGARYATWTTSGLLYGDRISVLIESEDPCAQQKNAGDTVVIGHPTSIKSNSSNVNGVSLYPNPNKGNFTISGIGKGRTSIQIIDITGRIVYNNVVDSISGTLEVDTQLSQGLYILRVDTDNGVQMVRFTVSQ